MSLAPLLETLLRGVPAVAVAGPERWWEEHRAATGSLPVFERAVAGGARADRLAWAFAAGYEAALVALMPERDGTRSAALCATELGGAHPAKIQTTIDEENRLTGDKTYVTLGHAAADLLVLARRGTREGGAVDLVLAEIPRDTRGVTLTALPETPFVPEIPHVAVRFDGAVVARVHPGDGWGDYVRPFRTVEDVHVHAALLGFLVARGRSWGWPRELLERAVATLVSLAALATLPPSSPAVHVALGGALASTQELVLALDRSGVWASVPREDRERFARDRPLLEIAGRARVERLGRAWEKLHP